MDNKMTSAEIWQTALRRLDGRQIIAERYVSPQWRQLRQDLTAQYDAGTLRLATLEDWIAGHLHGLNGDPDGHVCTSEGEAVEAMALEMGYVISHDAIPAFYRSLSRPSACKVANAISTLQQETMGHNALTQVALLPGLLVTADEFAKQWQDANPTEKPLTFVSTPLKPELEGITNPLARARKTLGLTRDQLAALSGVSASQIRKYEGGDMGLGNMALRNGIALADALGIDPRDLLELSNAAPTNTKGNNEEDLIP